MKLKYKNWIKDNRHVLYMGMYSSTEDWSSPAKALWLQLMWLANQDYTIDRENNCYTTLEHLSTDNFFFFEENIILISCIAAATVVENCLIMMNIFNIDIFAPCVFIYLYSLNHDALWSIVDNNACKLCSRWISSCNEQNYSTTFYL